MLDTALIKQAIEDLPPFAEVHNYTIPARDEKPRFYLGWSNLGSECKRAVWYDFRKVAKKCFPPRLYRLFNRGAREEFVFVMLLRQIGFTVHETDESGKQFSVKNLEGHLSGHMDGVGEAPKKFWKKGKPAPFLLEFKTYNDSRFKTLTKSGVRVSDPKYYGQMQGYMGEEGLSGALFCAVNKNDDDLYFEWVPLKAKDHQNLLEAAEEIVNSQTPPPKISNYVTDYRCRYCDFKDQCHMGAPSEKSCHSCKFGEPAETATWKCLKGGEFGTVCGEYQDIAR